MSKKGFDRPLCWGELALCHAELVSASDKRTLAALLVSKHKDVPPRQQMLKQVQHDNLGVQGDKRCAFTLAEVLITLAVIGTVAALTIPTVVRNYQKQQTVVQLKKIYSALSNTTNLAIANNGPIAGWAIGTDSTGQAAVDFSDTYLIPYLKVSKNCGIKTTQDCAFRYSHLNSPAISSLSAAYVRFFLNDGSLIAVLIINQETSRYARIWVDINGQKKPNIFGRDIFYFVYYIMFPSASMTGKFLPAEYARTRADLIQEGVYGTCTKNAGDWGGRYCAALIMKDGWHISDDYPW